MMRINRLTIAIAAAALSVGAAEAVTVHRSVTVDGPPLLVWLDVGGWCEIEDWLPPLTECEDDWEGGELYRTLTVEGGGTVKERRTDESEMSYSYEILESPLPVANYRATFSVSAADGGGTRIDWTAHFRAHGATDAEAASVIAGIFEAGMNKIAEDWK